MEIRSDTIDSVLREHIAVMVQRYTMRHKVTHSEVARSAMGDTKALRRIQQGDNFTMTTYVRLLKWLEDHIEDPVEGEEP